MPDRESHPTERKSEGVLRRVARAIVWLRFLILPAWIAAAVLATTHLPSVFNAETSQIGSLLPRSSTALEVERRAIDRFGFPLLSRTMVVARKQGGFSAADGAAASRYIATIDRQGARVGLRAVPLADAPGFLAGHRLGTTLVVYLYVDPSLSESEAVERAEEFGSGLKRVTGASAVDVTGTLPATAAETEIAMHGLLWVELATILLVGGILAFHFRSLGVPLLGLATVALAYLCADRVLGWMAQRYGIAIPREVDPVIVALLFGTLTDYLVFFVSGYRRRLREGVDSLEAVVEETAELLPVILTAALMIAGATLTLLISGVRFLSAFGPGMAVAVTIGAAAAVTLVPAALAIFGRLLLWPGWSGASERAGGGRKPEEADRRGRMVGVAAHHPLLVTLACLLALAAAAGGVRNLALGNPVVHGLPQSTPARQGYDATAASLGPGALGPTMLVLEDPGIAGKGAGLAALESRLTAADGVVGVLGPGRQPPPARRSGALLSTDGNAARYAIVLGADPEGAEAMRILSGLEDELPAMIRRSGLGEPDVGVTGDTTIVAELTEDTWTAFERVAPAALAVLLLLLWLLLRSWAAPLYLVGVSVLVVVASLGLTVYVFQGLLGYGELSFFVPVATAIVLLALGADYNVFLISRIWREADRQDLRPAIRTAGSRASRAITVAGLILALSFAAVALIPIVGFREIAFAIAVGLLLDTLIARTLLIPSLISLFGRGGAARDDDGTTASRDQRPEPLPASSSSIIR